jgi:hypothetical protein
MGFDDLFELVTIWKSAPRLARIATDEVWNGSQSVYVAYLRPGSSTHSGYLWQAVDAKPLRGKRVEVAVRVRVLERDVASGFMMYASILSGPSLEIWRNNNSRLPLRAAFPGSGHWRDFNWTRRAVYADVPKDADALLYAMSTTGWVDDVRVSIVGEAEEIGIGSTGAADTFPGRLSVSADKILPAPANLDFEEPALADQSAGKRKNCAGGAKKDADHAVDASR